jgi:succinoglycan biosynthesis protein ExoO
MATASGEAPSVSVIIPAYNASAYIERAILSAQQQTGHSLEIIVVDDCSTDNTCDVVRRLQLADDRIILHKTIKNGGPSEARNLAIGHAKGRWIAILDADDTWKQGRLKNLIEIALEQSCDIIADNYVLHDESRPAGDTPAFYLRKKWGELTPERFLWSERPGGRMRFGMLKPILRREFLTKKEISYSTEIRYAEDFHFFMNFLLHGAKAILISEAYYSYTLPSSLVTGKKSKGSRTVPNLDDRIWVADDLLKKFKGSLTPTSRAMLTRYRRWMVGARNGKMIMDLLRKRQFGKAAFSLLMQPRAALIYGLASGPVKRARYRFSNGCPPHLKL